MTDKGALDGFRRCGECGSWGERCASDVPQSGCVCARCARAELSALRRLATYADHRPLCRWYDGDVKGRDEVPVEERVCNCGYKEARGAV